MPDLQKEQVLKLTEYYSEVKHNREEFSKYLTELCEARGLYKDELYEFIAKQTGGKSNTVKNQIIVMKIPKTVDLMALIEKFFEERE